MIKEIPKTETESFFKIGSLIVGIQDFYIKREHNRQHRTLLISKNENKTIDIIISDKYNILICKPPITKEKISFSIPTINPLSVSEDVNFFSFISGGIRIIPYSKNDYIKIKQTIIELQRFLNNEVDHISISLLVSFYSTVSLFIDSKGVSVKEFYILRDNLDLELISKIGIEFNDLILIGNLLYSIFKK